MTSIILVNPQMGENIGAAARVMLNFGFTGLRLVAPRDGWPNRKAVDMSSGAVEKINVTIFENFESAIADLEILYATTARNRDMDKTVITPGQIELSPKTGIVFGPERTGLGNYEISLCNKIVEIPVNPEFSSLNLAQSVAVICYELRKSGISEVPNLRNSEVPLATKAELEGLYKHLEDELEKRNFFSTPEKQPGMMINIRNMLERAELLPQEVRTLRGIIRSLAEHGER